MSPLEREQPRIVEIGRHDHTVLHPSGVEDLVIGRRSESDRDSVDGLMPGAPEVPYSVTSSSARLAA